MVGRRAVLFVPVCTLQNLSRCRAEKRAKGGFTLCCALHHSLVL